MLYDSIAFDLDGTLWDTCATCALAWNDVAKRLGVAFREITADDVRAVTGRPHEECIRRTFVGVAEDELLALSSDTMTEDNARIAEVGGRLYPGVEQGIARLAARYRLLIVSSCQAGYIELFLRLSGLGQHFVDFECWGNTGRSKGDNLRALIERNALQRPLMVGDMDGDERAARECGVPFAFVSYGFGTAAAPDYSFDSFDDLVARLV